MSGDQGVKPGTPINELGLNKFGWEKLFADENNDYVAPPLPATTRHVLHALNIWMRGPVENENGEDLNAVEGFSCYPSTRRLAKNTGLSQRAVCEHLAKAEALGWIERHEHGSGKKWKGHEYIPCIPATARQRADGG